MEKRAVIALSCDNNYAKYAYVTVYSLLKNKKNNWNYTIYILCSQNVTIDNIELLQSLSRQDVDIVCKKVELHVDPNILEENLSEAACYRLLLPELIEEQKCLYMDVDVIVENDISELFLYEMGNNYLIGTKQIGVRLYYDDEGRKQKSIREEIPDYEYYINSGVIIMNLEKMRHDHLVEEFLKLTNRKWPGTDQHILNKVCYEKIGFMPYKYNMGASTVLDYEGLSRVFSSKEVSEAYKAPCIIHYVNEKPWKNIFRNWGEIWWKYASETPLFEQFCKELVLFNLNPTFYSRLFPYEENMNAFLTYLSGKTIIIYGAGECGRKFSRLLKKRWIKPFCFAVSDMIDNPASIDNIEVREIKDLVEYSDRCVVVIATAKCHQAEIAKILQQYGFNYYEFPESWYCLIENE